MLIHIQKPQIFPFAHTRPNINTLTYILSIYTSLCGTFLESFSIRSHEGRNCTQKKSPTSANVFSTLKSYAMTKMSKYPGIKLCDCRSPTHHLFERVSASEESWLKGAWPYRERTKISWDSGWTEGATQRLCIRYIRINLICKSCKAILVESRDKNTELQMNTQVYAARSQKLSAEEYKDRF